WCQHHEAREQVLHAVRRSGRGGGALLRPVRPPAGERVKGVWMAGLKACGYVLLTASLAQAQQMPDPSLIHGKALPAPELPDGTITVRVVRESIGNDIPGQTVSLTASGRTRTASTDAQGRAQFT